MNKKTVAVYLGRFCPFTRGHQFLTKKMVEEFGIENSLIMVGSSSSINERTPFSFTDRKKMINTIFPDLKVIPLPDMKPELIIFDGSTNSQWLNEVETIEKKMGAKFIFIGGSLKDLAILSERFDTKILSDRNLDPLKISGTRVRNALKENDEQTLTQMLDPRILGFIKNRYLKFQKENS